MNIFIHQEEPVATTKKTKKNLIKQNTTTDENTACLPVGFEWRIGAWNTYHYADVF